MSGTEVLVAIVAMASVFGPPSALIALHMRQRHKEKMRALDVSVEAKRVALLEAARTELEARVRTLETIVTEGDRDVEGRLRQLTAAEHHRLTAPDAPLRAR